MKKAAAEFIGTFALVLIGTGSIVINDVTGGAITHPGVSLTFGVVVFAMIYAFGDVSGAHFNPAVSVGFVIARRFPLRELPLYIASQFAGAIVASICLKLLFPIHQTLGSTHPGWSTTTAFITEVVLTTMLMFVILAVSTRAYERGINAALAIGGTVAVAALLGGSISGASMNPARSLGPAVAANNLQNLWIYLTAPFIGVALAIPLCRWARPAGCRCAAHETPF
ncbi:MAG TPA: aquaporin [Pyrinomonadaceae bacterium]|nr:aquaporin [Pyrinomonadaceae bacterium]